MHDIRDARMKKSTMYLVPGLAMMALGFFMLFSGFLTGRMMILYAGAGLIFLASVVQCLIFLWQSGAGSGTPAPARRRDASPPGDTRVIYADRLVSITEESITFFAYSFPLEKSRRVAFADIDHITVTDPSLASGKWRIWGSGDLDTWFPLDASRSSRDRIFTAVLKNGGMNVGFTVEDSSRVLAIFREHGKIDGTMTSS
jgi:hypothetical protein